MFVFQESNATGRFRAVLGCQSGPSETLSTSFERNTITRLVSHRLRTLMPLVAGTLMSSNSTADWLNFLGAVLLLNRPFLSELFSFPSHDGFSKREVDKFQLDIEPLDRLVLDKKKELGASDVYAISAASGGDNGIAISYLLFPYGVGRSSTMTLGKYRFSEPFKKGDYICSRQCGQTFILGISRDGKSEMIFVEGDTIKPRTEYLCELLFLRQQMPSFFDKDLFGHSDRSLWCLSDVLTHQGVKEKFCGARSCSHLFHQIITSAFQSTLAMADSSSQSPFDLQKSYLMYHDQNTLRSFFDKLSTTSRMKNKWDLLCQLASDKRNASVSPFNVYLDQLDAEESTQGFPHGGFAVPLSELSEVFPFISNFEVLYFFGENIGFRELSDKIDLVRQFLSDPGSNRKKKQNFMIYKRQLADVEGAFFRLTEYAGRFSGMFSGLLRPDGQVWAVHPQLANAKKILKASFMTFRHNYTLKNIGIGCPLSVGRESEGILSLKKVRVETEITEVPTSTKSFPGYYE